VLLDIFGRRELHLNGSPAQVMCGLMYQKQGLSLLGFVRMVGQALMHWIRAKMASPI